jgi:hypothetical protein
MLKILFSLAEVRRRRNFTTTNNRELKMLEDNNTTDQMGDGHPIPSELIDRIDVVSVTKSGEVQLSIISAGYLDDSPYTEERIIEKINTYLEFINSNDFKEEFGNPSVDKTSIILKCRQKPHDRVLDLIHEIQEQVKTYNASLSVETDKL